MFKLIENTFLTVKIQNFYNKLLSCIISFGYSVLDNYFQSIVSPSKKVKKTVYNKPVVSIILDLCRSKP